MAAAEMSSGSCSLAIMLEISGSDVAAYLSASC